MSEPKLRIEDDKYWRLASRRQYLPGAPEDDADPLSDEEDEIGGTGRRPHVMREVAETIILTLLIFFVVRAVVQNFKVDGLSMEPTLHHDQFLLVNKGLYFRYDANFLARLSDPSLPTDLRYLFHGPQRGDIVVFQAWGDEQKDYIKRVIATEGETVEIRAEADPPGGVQADTTCPSECFVYVNGVKLHEPYIKETPNYRRPLVTVPPGHVYVLGDNRRNSQDSHVQGTLPVEQIIGIAFLSYWSEKGQWGLLPHPTYAEMESIPTPLAPPTPVPLN
jgi:signal peptidase I